MCRISQEGDALEVAYVKVRSGRIGEPEGAMLVMDYVFRNRRVFGLSRMDEDDFVDFLLWMRGRFCQLFANYDPDAASLRTFLYGLLRRSLVSWKKRGVYEKSAAESAGLHYAIPAEEAEERYLLCEAPSAYRDDIGVPKRRAVAQGGVLTSLRGRVPGSRCNERYWSERLAPVMGQAIVIYALKSCAFMTEPLIAMAVQRSGVGEDELRRMLDDVRVSVSARQRRRDACERARDNAYFFRRRYMLLLSRAGKGTALEERLAQKVRMHDRSWRLGNERLGTRLFSVVPSNRAVAMAMGISERRVAYVMEFVSRNIDILGANRYDTAHEDIPCDVKHEQEARNVRAVSPALYSNAPRRRNSL